MTKLTLELFQKNMDDAVDIIRGYLEKVRQDGMSAMALGYGNFPTKVVPLQASSMEQCVAAAGREARKGKWACCILVFEASIGDRPRPGQPDYRDQAIIFIGEAPNLSTVVRQFRIDRMPDNTIRLGKLIEAPVESVWSPFGPMFGPDRN